MEQYTPESDVPKYNVEATALAGFLRRTLEMESPQAIALKEALDKAHIKVAQLTSPEWLDTITPKQRDELFESHEKFIKDITSYKTELARVANEIVGLIKTF